MVWVRLGFVVLISVGGLLWCSVCDGLGCFDVCDLVWLAGFGWLCLWCLWFGTWFTSCRLCLIIVLIVLY